MSCLSDQSGPIGILGGMGPQATIDLYQKIIELAVNNGAKDDADFPELLIANIRVPELISLEAGGFTTQAEQIFINKIAALKRAGAIKFCIPCNTAHLVVDRIKNKIDLPFISMIDAVCAEVIGQGLGQVGLLATPTTVNNQLYQSPLQKVGIQCLLPNAKQQKVVEKVIRSVLAGRLRAADKAKLIKIIDDLESRGAQAVTLGCTELPLAVSQGEVAVQIISSTEMLVKEISDRIFQRE